MNALADMPVSPPRENLPDTRPAGAARGGYPLAALAALAVHAAVLFAWPQAAQLGEAVEFGVEVGAASVQVELVAALPAEPEAIEPPPPEPEPMPPEPVPPEPIPEPLPEPPPPVVNQVPEMTLPEPVPIAEPRPEPPPKPRVEKAPPKVKPAVTRTARPVGDGSAAVPGQDATTSPARSGALASKPGYLRNPEPPYPSGARSAKQEGVVTLAVNVDAEGRPASVRVVRSSGFPLLDESARSTVATRWRFKPARSAEGVPTAAATTIPIRFRLDR